MNILTLTLNPAIDLHYTIDRFLLHRENRANAMQRHSGGKGINESRALSAFGIASTALVAVGEENAADFLQNLSGFEIKPLFIRGRVRENVTVHSSFGETRLSFAGERIPEDFAKRLYALLSPLDKDTVFAFSGSLPPGFSSNEASALIAALKAQGSRVVIDCSAFSLSELFSLQPFLIKPNAEEVAALVGRAVSKKEAAILASSWHKEGIDHVLLSMGADGLLYAGDDGVFFAKAPSVNVCSTIGAGDSAIAGFLAGQSLGLSCAECVRLSVAFGTAACLTPGSDPPRKEDIDRLRPAVLLTPIED